MNPDNLSSQLLYLTAPIWAETSDTKVATGTAFFYNLPVPKTDTYIPLIVTCHHVIAGARRVVTELVLSHNNAPNPNERITAEIAPELFAKFGDSSLDLAVAPIGSLMNALANQGKSIYFKGLTPDLALDKKKSSELGAIEDIIFVGYPSGLRDSMHGTPLVRRGITATPIDRDFQGKPKFLIDAGAFPGSSGSPVLIFNQGSYASGTSLVVGSRMIFVGMLCETMLRDEGNDNPKAYLGLGSVLRSDQIHSHIQSAFRQMVEESKN